MPRVILTDFKAKQIHTGAIIASKMALLRKRNEGLAKCIGKTERTVRSYYKAPDNIRLGDLWKMVKYLELSDSEIIEIVRGR